MSSFVEFLTPVIFIVGLIFTFIRRLKYSDYAFFPNKSEVILPSLASGWIVGLLVAVLFVIIGIEANRMEKTHWFLAMAIFALGGGIIGLIIQVVSALPAKLWRKFSHK